MKLTRDTLVFKPVTMTEWPDMQQLFGPNGADGGCWCMWWRIKRSEFDRNHGEANRGAMEAIIRSGEVPGLLAYLEDDPIGWCSVAPREVFPVLDRSPVLKRIDDQPVWSIVCFYIARRHRRCGLEGLLVEAALDYARSRGATIVEAYPVDRETRQFDPGSAFTGTIGTFQKLGFEEVARRSKRRAILRCRLG
ncbi:MAG: GNAT family N-acetyltransferase [Spirochaetaceae bacterium]|nr:MAG: GNAT family N-acetyltransferase [Spirochaetaceae bacterium]